VVEHFSALLFVLRNLGSNLGGDHFLNPNLLEHITVCGHGLDLPWLILQLWRHDQSTSSTEEEWNTRKEENLNPDQINGHKQTN
jgi:hypothetical protein